MARLLLCAGEASGDLLAAEILAEMRTRIPDLEVRGLAGPRLLEAGVVPISDSAGLGAVGLVESLSVLARARRALVALAAAMDSWQPDAVLTVDSPGLLLRAAGAARARGIPAVHAVSPQVWAWRPGRVRAVARACDLLLCLLPMEPALYSGTGLRALFVGHPVVDRVRWSPPGRADTVVLLPGSRRAEVRRHWPVLRKSVEGLRSEVLVAPTVDPAWLPGAMSPLRSMGEITAGAALTASGTATLELAARGLPHAALYQVHPLTYLAGRALVRTQWLALPSIILGRQVVPEHVQRLEPAALARDAQALLGPAGEVQRESLAEVRAALGPPGAAGRMADALADLLT